MNAAVIERERALEDTLGCSCLHVPAGIVLTESNSGEPALGLDPNAEERDDRLEVASGLLEAFVRLADEEPEGFLDFARRYGLLNLCGHDLPACHYPIPYTSLAFARRYSFPCFPVVLEPGGMERLDTWRRFSRVADALLSIAAKLRDGKKGARADWRTVVGASDVERKVRSVTRQKSIEEDDWVLLAHELQRWLQLGNVRPVLRGFDQRLDMDLSSEGLFPNIAKQLVFTVAGFERISFCDGCGRVYVPTRKPRPDRRKFCKHCNEAGVPAKLRVRDHRARMKIRRR